MQPSPELLALDLIRLDVESMSLEDLDVHKRRVLDTISELGALLKSGVRGVMAQAIRSRKRKLQLHVAFVQDVRNAKLAAQAQLAMLQQTGKSSGTPGYKP